MDIRKFAVSPTSRLHLRDANDELLFADEEKTRPIAVNLYGPGSKEYARAQAAQSSRMIEKLKRKGKTEKTAEQRAAESAEFLSGCTESWENMEYDQLTGDALSQAVYSDITIGFIADQVAKHISDWSNFTRPSTTN